MCPADAPTRISDPHEAPPLTILHIKPRHSGRGRTALYQGGVPCRSTYSRMMATGAPPQEATLNREILDRGWGEFKRQLDYKLAWTGGRLVAVYLRNTSRTCPACGRVAKENRTTRARSACTAYGFAEDAGLVGAINIPRAGHARLACEMSAASSRTPGPAPGPVRAGRQQQEPAEATAAGFQPAGAPQVSPALQVGVDVK